MSDRTCGPRKRNYHDFNGLSVSSTCRECGLLLSDLIKDTSNSPQPMANLEVNTQLFDGLSLHQRMQALIELTTWRNQAREERVEAMEKFGERSAENGCYIAHYVREDAINAVLQHLIDSTVEKFGGGK